MMFATCVTVRDPFNPAGSREYRELQATGPISALAIKEPVPFIILRNGEPVMRADWDQAVNEGDIFAVVVLPEGGGGGSNPLRMLLMLAVTVFAPYAGAWAAGQMGATLATGSFAAGAVSAASIMVGSMLVNAIIPPPKPTSAQQAQALAAPSPTYNLQAQGNMARLDQAIPVQYGRMMAFPDFAATPYVEYAGNEQFLYQLLCLGQGEYDIEAIRIEDTPIANFAEITYEVIPPGGSITLFPSNVATSPEVSGQDLAGMKAATYTRSGTVVTVTLTGHNIAPGKSVYLDFTSGGALDDAYTVVSAPTVDTFTVTTAASGTITTSNVNVHRYLGSYVANAAGTSANTIGIDFVTPRGLYKAENDGTLTSMSVSVVVEARTIDGGGAPIGGWSTLGTETITDKTTTPQRISRRYNVAAGRYEVRMRRTDTKQTDTVYGHEIIWAGMRAYFPETRTFGDVTLIAMRLRASNNLSAQASRKINVISTRKLPIWNGSTWSAPTATGSIAWAIADACRNTTYGGKLADTRIDLTTLLALDVIWTARGDEFNGRFDSAISFWEAISKLAVAGRAKPFMQGGIVRVMRDGPATVPVALFSMRNIKRGSLSIDYIMPSDESADAVEMAYFDSQYWSPQRVTCTLAGSTADKPAKVELFGVTSRQQAYKEGLYQAASNRYRRRIVKFSTEMEGFIPSPGDLIAIQHDMPAWGQHAEATAWNEDTRALTLSEPMTFAGGAHYVGLRTKAGGVDGPHQFVQGYVQTNMLRHSEAFNEAIWASLGSKVLTANTDVAPDGEQTADTLTDSSAVSYFGIWQAVTVPNNSSDYTFTVYVKKTSGGTAPTFGVNMALTGGTPVYTNHRLNTDTGVVSLASIQSSGDYWRFICRITNNTTGNTQLGVSLYPAACAAGSMSDSSAAQGSAVIWGAQLETGSVATKYLRTDANGHLDPYTVILSSTPSFTPYTGSQYERTHVVFGAGETWRQPARVIAIRPRGLYEVEVEAVNEDPSVHTAESGMTAPAVTYSTLQTLYTAPVISNLTMASSSTDNTKALLTWTPAPGADGYQIEMAQGTDPYAANVSWTRVGETSANNFAVTALYGAQTLIRIRATGMTVGPWVTVFYGSSADYMWTNDAALMWNAVTTTPMWRY
jgi:hypothetical protein